MAIRCVHSLKNKGVNTRKHSVYLPACSAAAAEQDTSRSFDLVVFIASPNLGSLLAALASPVIITAIG